MTKKELLDAMKDLDDDADCPDSLRYKAIGNSMAVPVMRWIEERIENFMEGQKND